MRLRERIRLIMDHAYYQFSMGIMALICVFSLLAAYKGSTSPYIYWLDLVIYMIFVLDYFTGLWAAANRKEYIKTHVIELIAIIPFSIWFQSARILQLIRLFRALIYFKRAILNFRDVFERYHLVQTLLVVFLLVFIGGIIVYLIEPQSFDDNWMNSIWWAAVTVTTVGYGDFFPTTLTGRVLAVLIMLLGTAFISLLSGILAGYYVRQRMDEESDPWKQSMIQEIERLEKLSDDERARLIRMIDTYGKEESLSTETVKEHL